MTTRKPESLDDFVEEWTTFCSLPEDISNRSRVKSTIKSLLLGLDGSPGNAQQWEFVADKLDSVLSPEDRAVRHFMRSTYQYGFDFSRNNNQVSYQVLEDSGLFQGLFDTFTVLAPTGLAGTIKSLECVDAFRRDLSNLVEESGCPHLSEVLSLNTMGLLRYASDRLTELLSDQSLDTLTRQTVNLLLPDFDVSDMILALLKQRPDATLFYDPDTEEPCIDVLLFPPKSIEIDGYEWTNKKSIHVRFSPFASSILSRDRLFSYRLHTQAHGTPRKSLRRTPSLHPHVNTYGDICFGEGADTANILKCNNRIVEFMDLAVATLNNYSELSPYWFLPLPEEPGNGLQCSVCDSLDGSHRGDSEDEDDVEIRVEPLQNLLASQSPRGMIPSGCLHPDDMDLGLRTPLCRQCWEDRYMEGFVPYVASDGTRHSQYAVSPWVENRIGRTPEESVWTAEHPTSRYQFLKSSFDQAIDSRLFRNIRYFVEKDKHYTMIHNGWVGLHKEFLSNDSYHKALVTFEEPQAQGQEEEQDATVQA